MKQFTSILLLFCVVGITISLRSKNLLKNAESATYLESVISGASVSTSGSNSNKIKVDNKNNSDEYKLARTVTNNKVNMQMKEKAVPELDPSSFVAPAFKHNDNTFPDPFLTALNFNQKKVPENMAILYDILSTENIPANKNIPDINNDNFEEEVLGKFKKSIQEALRKSNEPKQNIQVSQEIYNQQGQQAQQVGVNQPQQRKSSTVVIKS